MKSDQSLVKDRRDQYKTLEGFLHSKTAALAKVAPRFLTPMRLVNLALSCTSRSPQILQATPQSLLLALMDAAYYGLEPNPALGHAYLVPFRNNKKGGIVEVQCVVGFKGLILLAHRSKAVVDITPVLVYKKDRLKIAHHADPPFEHEYRFGEERGALLGVYAKAKLPSGAMKFLEPMTLAEVDKARARSAAGDSGPWSTDYEAMVMKTAVRRLCKMLPMEPNTQLAQSMAQEGEFEDRGEAVYVNPLDESATEAGAVESTRGDNLADRLRQKGQGRGESGTEPPAAA